MRKRILSLLLCAAMLLTLAPAALAEEAEEAGMESVVTVSEENAIMEAEIPQETGDSTAEPAEAAIELETLETEEEFLEKSNNGVLSADYAYLMASEIVSGVEMVTEAVLVFTDGTRDIVTINPASNINGTGMYAYEVDPDGRYYLYPDSNCFTSSNANNYVTNSVRVADSIKANANTRFIVETYDAAANEAVYTVYTGIANVPNVVSMGYMGGWYDYNNLLRADCNVAAIVNNGDTYASVVYFFGAAVRSVSKDLVALYVTGNEPVCDDGNGAYAVVKAIVNGEETTVKVADYEFLRLPRPQLVITDAMTVDSNGYITAFAEATDLLHFDDFARDEYSGLYTGTYDAGVIAMSDGDAFSVPEDLPVYAFNTTTDTFNLTTIAAYTPADEVLTIVAKMDPEANIQEIEALYILENSDASAHSEPVEPYIPEEQKPSGDLIATYTDTVRGGILYMALGKENLYAVDSETGAPLWETNYIVDGRTESFPIGIVSGGTREIGRVGDVIEVYKDAEEKSITIVQTNYYLAQIAEVIPAKTDLSGNVMVSPYVQLYRNSIHAKPARLTYGGTAMWNTVETDAFTKADRDAYVTYTIRYDDNGDCYIGSVARAQTVTGRYTGHVLGESVTIDGVKYRAHESFFHEGLSLNVDVNAYLDPNGNVLSMEAIASENYAYVLGVAETGSVATVMEAVLVFTDGTRDIVTINPASNINGTGMYAYEVDPDGRYYLYPDSNCFTSSNANNYVTNTVVVADSIKANANTRFIVETYDAAANQAVYTVYTGIANVPNVVSMGYMGGWYDYNNLLRADCNVAAIVNNGDTYASVVYFFGAAVRSVSKDMVALYVTGNEPVCDDGNGAYAVVKAIVNGEETTLKVTQYVFEGLQGSQIFVTNNITLDSNGYITAFAVATDLRLFDDFARDVDGLYTGTYDAGVIVMSDGYAFSVPEDLPVYAFNTMTNEFNLTTISNYEPQGNILKLCMKMDTRVNSETPEAIYLIEDCPSVPFGECGDDLMWTIDNGTTLRIKGSGLMEDYASADAAPWAKYADSVQTIEVAHGVNTIGENAFACCPDGVTVILPDTLAQIGSGAFAGVRPASIYFEGTQKQWAEITADAGEIAAENLIAKAQMTLEVSKVTAVPGLNATVAISVTENPGIAGMLLSVHYPEELTLTDVQKGTALGTMKYTPSATMTLNPFQILWDDQKEDHSTGTIAYLTFTVDQNAEPGEYPITVSYQYGDVYTGTLQDVDLVIDQGSVTVREAKRGDANGDGEVNGKDITALRRYLTGGYGVQISENAADVTLDGTANGKDVTVLRRYFAGGYGIELN